MIVVGCDSIRMKQQEVKKYLSQLEDGDHLGLPNAYEIGARLSPLQECVCLQTCCNWHFDDYPWFLQAA